VWYAYVIGDLPTSTRNIAMNTLRIYANMHNMHKNVLTYVLTAWSTVLLEKLTGFQLVKKFPAFYGTRRYITAFTSARNLSLS